MSDETLQSPPDPVVRFRIRTVFTVTTIVAIVAAIAAPYWRAQEPTVQKLLLVFWGCFVAFAALGGWRYWRQSSQVPPQAGRIAFMGWPTGRKPWLPAAGLTAMIISLALISLVITMQSWSIARDNSRLSLRGAIFNAGFKGMCFGFMMGGAVLVFMRKPLYLCEEGVPGPFGFAPWKYIRHAEWVADRPGVMKLRRLDGDIYVDVPNPVRGEAEAFVRGKTRFVDEAALPPV
jgi:hypothetical protein